MYMFLMRGVTCSGKSTLAQKLFPTIDILSSDKFRSMLTGDAESQHANALVFETLRSVMNSRMSDRAIVVIDATNLKFADAKEYFEAASKWGYSIVVLNVEPLPLEELVARSKARAITTGFNVPETAIVKQFERYTNCTPIFKQSLSTYKNVSWFDIQNETTLHEVNFFIASVSGLRPLLPAMKVDSNVFEVFAIGDVHGCISELTQLMEICRISAEINNREARFVLLGDLIDRGPHSFESLMMVKHETVICSVLGNHEWLFIQELNGKPCRSMSRAVTHEKYQELSDEGKQSVFDVITSMPAALCLSYNETRYVLSHAPMAAIFQADKDEIYTNFRAHSMTRYKPDLEALEKFDSAKEPYVHIHGHQSWQYEDINNQLNEQRHLSSKQLNIDSSCVYGGVLTALRLRDLAPIQVQSSVNADKEVFGPKK